MSKSLGNLIMASDLLKENSADATAQSELRKMAMVFGLRLTDNAPEKRVVAGWGRHLARFI